MARTERKDAGAAVNEAGVSYGELIRRFRREKGLSQEELGACVNVGKNAVGAWEAGRSRPDLSSVPVICEALGISVPAFFGLTDPQADISDHGEDDTNPFLERFEQLNGYHRQVILREMDVLVEMQKAQEAPHVRKLIPVHRSDLAACAGPSFHIGEASGETVWLYADEITEYADEIISVSGDSMEPAYHDGDQVLVRHSSAVRPGEIGIFTNGDAGYIKEYQKEGLRSLNPAYPMMRFHEGDEVRCIGKVIGKLTDDMIAAAQDVERYRTEHRRG